MYDRSMLGAVKRFFVNSSYPLNKILIKGSNLKKNYQTLSKINSQIKVAPVLKSNAYGHGIELVGKVLDQVGAPFLCVDSLFEAYQLKKAGVKSQILIMGYIDPRSLGHRKLPFSYTVFDLEFAKALDQHQKGAQVHVFVGTGMSREGVLLNELEEFLKQLKDLKNIKVVGLMSHLSSAEKPQSEHTKRQIKNFKQAKDKTIKFFPEVRWFHLGGSWALTKNSLKDCCNLIRCGKAIYGLEGSLNLAPSLKLTTTIAQIKNISKGAFVGYNETFRAPAAMTVGILPIGYNDGVDRRLSNKGFVSIAGIKCQIIGRISMNITTIDLSRVKNPFVGQEVVIYSDSPNDINSLEKAAEICQTIPLDILVHLNASIRRELV